MLSTIQQQCVAGDEASREMKAKSGRLWNNVAPAVHSRGPQDIIRTPPRIRCEAHAENEMNAFNLLIQSINPINLFVSCEHKQDR